ncbi:MAG TPA: DUF1641 domain-containing protein [Chloroflexi bacterium]|nr:DUF1641 domain-containing protein [Chloroflexota bacterium]
MTATAISQEQLSLLLERLDRIKAHLAEQRRRQEELDELKRDLIPIGNQMVKISIDELAEIGSDFSTEDLFFLLKRLLRDIHLLLKMLDQLESAMGLAEELNRLSKPMLTTVVQELDRLERAGFFTLLRAGWVAVQEVAGAFQPDDVDAFAQEAAALLTALKSQPEETPSLWHLARQMRDPQTRRGLARALGLLQALGSAKPVKTSPSSPPSQGA